MQVRPPVWNHSSTAVAPAGTSRSAGEASIWLHAASLQAVTGSEVTAPEGSQRADSIVLHAGRPAYTSPWHCGRRAGS